ncbi:hypothetical protein FQA39_LY10461 [Lamprigera yunnana]|nr:hypothetical protein FQA39_LY10461 [Lamprigera yunnana]
MCEKVPAVDTKTIAKISFDENSSDFDWFSSDSIDEYNLEIPPQTKHIRVQKFEEVLEKYEKYSDDEFKKHFRLSKTTSNVCISNLENANVLPTHSSGREKVFARKSFLMTLWYLSNQETYRQVNDRFEVTESAAWKIIRRFFIIMCDASTSYNARAPQRHVLSEDASKIVWNNYKHFKSINSVKNQLDNNVLFCYISLQSYRQRFGHSCSGNWGIKKHSNSYFETRLGH